MLSYFCSCYYCLINLIFIFSKYSSPSLSNCFLYYKQSVVMSSIATGILVILIITINTLIYFIYIYIIYIISYLIFNQYYNFCAWIFIINAIGVYPVRKFGAVLRSESSSGLAGVYCVRVQHLSMESGQDSNQRSSAVCIYYSCAFSYKLWYMFILFTYMIHKTTELKSYI